mgnify:CR=1 FL=1
MKKVTVIGSGFTGCMFAMMLKNKDWDVTVIDKASFTGGGVRTFYHGGHPFTYGPHHLLVDVEWYEADYETGVYPLLICEPIEDIPNNLVCLCPPFNKEKYL